MRPIPKGWTVEWTCGWLMFHRRAGGLAEDAEWSAQALRRQLEPQATVMISLKGPARIVESSSFQYGPIWL